VLIDMAWNDPGNSPGKRNPWEKRPGKTASSGLDQVLKQFKKRMAGPGAASSGVLVLIIISLLLWISSGVYQISSGQVAVVSRFGKFQRIEQPGLAIRFPVPIESAQLVSTAEDEKKDQVRIVTRDESYIDVVYALRFRRADLQMYAFNVRDPEAAITAVTQSALRDAFAHESLVSALNSARTTIATRIRDLIQRSLDLYQIGIVVNSLDVVDVRVPSEVKPAQDEVTKAQSDAAAATARAREYLADVIPKARGAAAVIINEAESYRTERIARATGEIEQFSKLLPEYQKAPAATRERIYVETLESIYKNSRKIFVDAHGATININADRTMPVTRDSAEAKTNNNAATIKGAR
jgi:membrane protease subunit HflK